MGNQLYKALRSGQAHLDDTSPGRSLQSGADPDFQNTTQQQIGEVIPIPVGKRTSNFNLGLKNQPIAQKKEEPDKQKYSPENSIDEKAITERNDTRLTFSTLSPLGQFAGTFILASAGDVLYIIDQHAAAERIQYEKILHSVETSKNDSAMLAIPIQFEVSPREQLLLQDNILEIRDLGFILEHFGGTSYIIRGVPIWLGETAPEPVLRDYLDYLQEKGSGQQTLLRQQELFYMACRRAVKANQHLTNADILTLFAELDKCKESTTCPHGRPVCLRLTLEDIYKHFLRGSI